MERWEHKTGAGPGMGATEVDSGCATGATCLAAAGSSRPTAAHTGLAAIRTLLRPLSRLRSGERLPLDAASGFGS